MAPVSVMTTTAPGNPGLTCTRMWEGHVDCNFCQFTNQRFSLSVHWKYSILPAGISCVFTQAQLSTSRCAALNSWFLHVKVWVWQFLSHASPCVSEVSSVLSFSLQPQEDGLHPPCSHSPLKSILQTGKLRPPRCSVLGPALWAVDNARRSVF